MNKDQQKRTSKFLSLVLRHKPETIGLSLDENGWADVNDLVTRCEERGSDLCLTRAVLEKVVAENDKQRFEFNEDGSKIRARQGHSISIDLGYLPSKPPETLLHGTPETAIGKIRLTGLKKMSRHHVHMHSDEQIAKSVGDRRGKSVLLVIQSGRMFLDGYEFFVTENGVWLTDHVPTEYLQIP